MASSILALLLGLLLSSSNFPPTQAKIGDFGEKLPEFVKTNPSKGWLIKFYTHWCHQCQKFEPTFINVAERVQSKLDDLIVGQVDCDKYRTVCEDYDVHSYPTVKYIGKGSSVPYEGDRSLDLIVDFVERMHGPDLRTVADCKHLSDLHNRHRVMLLSAGTNTTSQLFKEFKTLAKTRKATLWFYQVNQKCKQIPELDGVYILKRNLYKPIKFSPSGETSDLKQELANWIKHESYPLYGHIHWWIYKEVIKPEKLTVIAVLDEYKPARKLTPASRKLDQLVERIAIKYAQKDDQLVFVRSTDMDLINHIAISRQLKPNIMIVKPDLSYHVLVQDEKEFKTNPSIELPAKLGEDKIMRLIEAAKLDELDFYGGSSTLHWIARYWFNMYCHLVAAWSIDPLLTAIVCFVPFSIMAFLTYTCMGGDDNQPQLQPNDDRETLLNHLKRD